MGLDVYLKGRKYVSGWGHESDEVKKQFTDLVKLAGLDELPCPASPSGYIELTVAYWRKANAIHKWFVDNCQDGLDECQTSYVDREQLKELLDLCKKVAENQKTGAEALPTESGFFFGGTEYDDYYMEDIKLTIDQLEKVLVMDDGWEFAYQSSW